MAALNEAQRANLLAWAAALRSGEYQQGTGKLRPSPTTFCCLGVACELSGLGEWSLSCNTWSDAYSDFWIHPDLLYSNLMPIQVLEFYGLDQEEQEALAKVNDHGGTFDEIADLIEWRAAL